jgi:hypothetical protein
MLIPSGLTSRNSSLTFTAEAIEISALVEVGGEKPLVG